MDMAGMAIVRWRKSSHSGGSGGECVEVAQLPGSIGVRDSKNVEGPHLVFRSADWRTFARRVKSGEHDLS
ncbi:DUF397 domain-containing protein [Actinomadura sp. 9N407]|uniref:DUF397 domain-containing protein n=1 Tax=Actinomadura sp. 9N407 TaxID=3375154 RepID=UPI0037B318C7